jgi:hypothetical protein
MFKFRKIASVLASAIMVSSTVALAAAANYPAPFVSGGNSDVAIVYGTGAGSSPTDVVAAADISTSLNTELAKQTATSGSSGGSVSVSGEAAPLYTSATPLFLNDTLNAVKSVLTDTDLPQILGKETFSGNVETTVTQTIVLGSNPRFVYAQIPTTNTDPLYGLGLSSSTGNEIYNATATFGQAIAFNSSDSIGQDITLFGQKFTVAAATTATDLVLLKTAERISLSNENPTVKITIDGKEYTVTLKAVSSTANTATVQVTDASGNTESKPVTVNGSKKIQGVTVAVTEASTDNFGRSASVIVGAQKVTLTHGSPVATGDDNTQIDGTKVIFNPTGSNVGALQSITIAVSAPGSDDSALLPGGSFVDPVFGSFKIAFASVNVPENNSAREVFSVKNSGNNKLQLTMADKYGVEKTIQYTLNASSGLHLSDADARNYTVAEGQIVKTNDYVVVGNEEYGRLLKLSRVTNSTSSDLSADRVEFQDVFSGETIKASITSKGVGSLSVAGKSYSVVYKAIPGNSDSGNVTLNYPDSSGNNVILYPTFESKNGAKVFFYEPISLNTTSWDGTGSDISGIKLPNGNGFSDITVTVNSTTSTNITQGSTLTTVVKNGASTTVTAGALTYNISSSADHSITVSLIDPKNGGNIANPVFGIIEDKDQNSVYNAVLVTSTTTGDGVGVNQILTTWNVNAGVAPNGNTAFYGVNMESDSDVQKFADVYGVIGSVDSSATQKSAMLSYPTEQLINNIYIGASDVEISGGVVTSSGNGNVKTLGNVIVKDSDASSITDKNLVVVGGSCINSVAASLLGGALCGADFTTKTTAAKGQFLIQTFSRTTGGKVATLVAGYDAADTTNAARYLTTQTVDTSVGKKYVGTSATQANVVATTQ